MKKYIGFIGLALICLSIVSCKKDNFNYPEGTVGSSKITYYPIVTLKGDQLMAVTKGSTFTDPGVDAIEGSNPIKATVKGSVDTNTPGVYTLVYTAVNKDGYSATTYRNVAVSAPDATAADNDFSGSYLRAATGVSSVWTKLVPGAYKVVNPGGAVGADNIVVLVLNQTGLKITMPSQTASSGTVSSTSETTTAGSAAGTLRQYTWVFLSPGYGTGVRTFVKQ